MKSSFNDSSSSSGSNDVTINSPIKKTNHNKNKKGKNKIEIKFQPTDHIVSGGLVRADQKIHIHSKKNKKNSKSKPSKEKLTFIVEAKGKKKKIKINHIIDPNTIENSRVLTQGKVTEEKAKILIKYLQREKPEYVQRYTPLKIDDTTFVITYNLCRDSRLSDDNYVGYDVLPLKSEKNYLISDTGRNNIRTAKHAFKILGDSDSKKNNGNNLTLPVDNPSEIVIKTCNTKKVQNSNVFTGYGKAFDPVNDINNYDKYHGLMGKKDPLKMRKPLISSSYHSQFIWKKNKEKIQKKKKSCVKTRTIMNKMPGGDLKHYRTNDNEFTPSTLNILTLIVDFIRQYAAQLYDKDIIHKDIKPDNILITAKNKLVFSDFEFAVHHNDGKEAIQKFGGTFGYIPPECYPKFATHNECKNDFSQDFFAVGMTIAYLLNPHSCAIELWNKKKELDGNLSKEDGQKDEKKEALFYFWKGIIDVGYYDPLQIMENNLEYKKRVYEAQKKKIDEERKLEFLCDVERNPEKKSQLQLQLKKQREIDPKKSNFELEYDKLDLLYCLPDLNSNQHSIIRKIVHQLTAAHPEKRPENINQLLRMAEEINTIIQEVKENNEKNNNNTNNTNILKFV